MSNLEREQADRSVGRPLVAGDLDAGVPGLVSRVGVLVLSSTSWASLELWSWFNVHDRIICRTAHGLPGHCPDVIGAGSH
ncbi:hypothetical protein [Nonomuraea sp. NEAU-A123]|uniref:hypothetical protein n=1 Tax=Nonomuraea sp. NEAU-A123 TaxID=2839649 RepID=UPI001BE3D5CA|nr:hypothetical protein [Nonomuraea sp. NEAU-A123]MBT2233493.1 hypothetical protein [Nonomuraea sp. NEAU-A123]